MPTIGPTFHAELVAAGVTSWGHFSWGGDGSIEIQPEVPDDERKKILAVLAAHGPLSEARHQALEATRAEAAKRIADLYLQPPNTLDAAYAEINALDRGFQILAKIIDGSALPEERLDLDVFDTILTRKAAIREAGRDAKAAVLAAKSVEEVQAVKVGWPADE